MATTQNVLASGLQAANPSAEIKMRWFVSSQLYVQSCSNRNQARLLIQDGVLLKKEGNKNLSAVCKSTFCSTTSESGISSFHSFLTVTGDSNCQTYVPTPLKSLYDYFIVSRSFWLLFYSCICIKCLAYRGRQVTAVYFDICDLLNSSSF